MLELFVHTVVARELGKPMYGFSTKTMQKLRIGMIYTVVPVENPSKVIGDVGYILLQTARNKMRYLFPKLDLFLDFTPDVKYFAKSLYLSKRPFTLWGNGLPS